MELISEQEWNDLSELKQSFNKMELESAVTSRIQVQGYPAFEELVFKIHFFVEAIKSCCEHTAGGNFRIESSALFV